MRKCLKRFLNRSVHLLTDDLVCFMGKLLLNSKGFNTAAGSVIIRSAICDNDLKDPCGSSIVVVSYPDYGLDDKILHNLTEILGFKAENVMFSHKGIPGSLIPDYIYVTEGNTFEILWYMQHEDLISYIKEMMNKQEDLVYIGSSAGAIIAGTDILVAKDFENNPVGRMDFSSLGLFDGAIIPHCGKDEFEIYKSNNAYILDLYGNVLRVGNEDVLVI